MNVVPDRQRKIARRILILATILFLGSLLPVGMMISFSPTPFAAGAKPGAWIFAIILFAYPVVVLITLTAAWICFAKQAYRVAMWLNVIPIVYLIVLFAPI